MYTLKDLLASSIAYICFLLRDMTALPQGMRLLLATIVFRLQTAELWIGVLDLDSKVLVRSRGPPCRLQAIQFVQSREYHAIHNNCIHNTDFLCRVLTGGRIRNGPLIYDAIAGEVPEEDHPMLLMFFLMTQLSWCAQACSSAQHWPIQHVKRRSAHLCHSSALRGFKLLLWEQQCLEFGKAYNEPKHCATYVQLRRIGQGKHAHQQPA